MQTEQYIDFYQPRTFTQVLNSTFIFIRQNFAPLLKYLLIIVGPALVLAAVAFVLVQAEILQFAQNAGTTENSGNWLGINPVIIYMTGFFLAACFAGFVLYGTVFAYLSLYNDHKGRNFDLTDVWTRVRSGLPVLFSTAFAVFFIFLLLFIALVFASSFVMNFMFTSTWLVILLLFGTPLIAAELYCSVAFSLLFTVSLQEKPSVGDAIIRSFSLVRGNWWQTTGILVILLLVKTLLSYIISLPAYFFTGERDWLFSFTAPTIVLSTGSVIFSALILIINYLLYTIPLAGMIIQYYNLVERKEAPGLMERVNTMTEPEQMDEDSLPAV